MVFGAHSGSRPPAMDEDGHLYDPNMAGPYNVGPYNQPYISDPTHPDYDPAIDPNLQLRTVRTAAESIAESHRSEARREERAKAKRKGSILNRLGRGRTLLRRNESSKRGHGSSTGHGQGPSAIAELVHGELDRIRKGNDADQPHHGSGADGTAGPGVGVPFDSAQQDVTPAYPTADEFGVAEAEAEREKRLTSSTSAGAAEGATELKKKKNKKPAKRRNVYLNVVPTSPNEVDRKGNPTTKYPRNKVRTSKYTVVTFLPRFLSEQFRRLANIYFLGLVLIQTSDKFGATIPQIAMLPLVAILAITAIKDGIEDYRRHVLDNEVNNSAVTRLGNWRNVNQPRDPRSIFAKMFGLNNPQKVSKGVRKLREKEDAIGMRIVGQAARQANANLSANANGQGRVTENGVYQGGAPMRSSTTTRSGRSDSLNSGYMPGLETIASESNAPSYYKAGSTNALINGSTPDVSGMPSSRSSLPSRKGGVVDHTHQTPGSARWERTLWKKLEVGDVVLLRENEQVPADIVLLNSSDPDGNAFVETKNLDGETNLKIRKCLTATSGIQTEEDVEHARFVIDSEPPHANLYAYNGLLKYNKTQSNVSGNDPYGSQQTLTPAVEPITANELLLRGCILRNTEWAIGIVVFTGKDTKIMLNGGDTPSKRSKIEKETNVNVAVNFVILLLMCIACAVVGGLVLNYTDTSRDFYEPNSTDSSSNIINALYIFGSCLVLYQNIVPISLYISIELTKTISAFFIYQDIDMYYEPLDHPCVPKTWGIVDDLGQIEYIFSDKTGTLTQNVMEFKKCSINGVQYGEGITEAMLGAMKREGKDTTGLDMDSQAVKLEAMKQEMVDKLNRTFKNRYIRSDKLTLISPALADDVASTSALDQRRNISTFFRALALCHTALADRADSGDPFALDYKAQSPDEAALVAAARDVGAVFLNKNNHAIDIEVMGSPERLTPLKVLEFNSTRKRMSVIVREADGKILLICKGADSVIYQRLRPDHPVQLKEKTQHDLEDFANAGLRTLCIAYRYLEEGEYLEWARLHDEAAASLTDRDEMIDEVCEKIEVNLNLIGATALEDKLQVGVPEAIEKLHQAGIKLWILTGDKLQTAIEIGFSCNLLSSDMEIMIISADHEQGARAQLEAACNKIAASGRPVVVRPSRKGVLRRKQGKKQRFDGSDETASDKSGFAVVVDGETLKFCLDKQLKPLFLALTTQCETVVCCRVSPAQKALTVRLVKDGIDAMTLSIGDGANDVSMIQEAHIGVGIAGLEGAQASMSADYAIGQFRFLTKLLLVHGHWNTYRIGVLHQVFFYKNLIWTFTLLFFQIFCEANATYLFDYSLVLLYNLVFTSLPVIMLGSLDQDVRAPALMAFPQTYAPGREGKLYTRSQFWFACIDGVYQSVVCFGISAASWYYFPVVNANGLSLDPLTAMGTTVGACAVVSANLYCGMLLQNWSVIIWVVIIISNLSYFVWISIYSAPLFANTYTSTAYVLFGTIQFWVTLLLCVVASLLPRFTLRAWLSCFHPTHTDLVRQAWVGGNLKQALGVRPGLGDEKTPSAMEDGRRSKPYHDGESAFDLTPTSRDPALYEFEPEQYYRQSPGQGYETRSAQPDGKRHSHLDEGHRKHLKTPEGIPMRADSSFSFYDPDHIRSAYTPEPNLSHISPAGNEEHHDDFDNHNREQQGYHYDPALNIPQIHVQRASMTGSRNGNPTYSPYNQDAVYEASTSRTALAGATSVDSFEVQFQNAFSRNQVPKGSAPPAVQTFAQRQQQHAADEANEEEEKQVSPLQRFHNRFQQQSSPPQSSPLANAAQYDSYPSLASSSDPTDDALTAPPHRTVTSRALQGSVDSDAGGYYTPDGHRSREASESSPLHS